MRSVRYLTIFHASRVLTVTSLVMVLSATTHLWAEEMPLGSGARTALKETIIQQMEAEGLMPAESHRLHFAAANLDDDPPLEVLVLLQGPTFCGTGGCTLWLFDLNPDLEFTFGGRIGLVREHLWVAPGQHRGWHDLVVQVSGGGQPTTLRRLVHNGLNYPENPTVAPRIKGDPKGLMPIMWEPVLHLGLLD